MEISKTIEISCDKIKNAYKKDIEKAIDKLFQEYDIYKRGSKEIISKKELEFIFLQGNFEVKYCSAATKSGTKCKNKALENTNFCGKHLYSTENLRNLLHAQQLQQQPTPTQTQKNSEFYIIENKLNTNDNDNDNINIKKNIINNLQNVLIENAFYYTDNIWVYDKESMEKVGYVDINNADFNYILTSDPFILQNF